MNQKEILAGLILLAIAAVLLRNSRCNCGCKTIAQHLISKGVDDVVDGLFA